MRLSDTAASKADAEKRRRRIGTNLAHAVDSDAGRYGFEVGSHSVDGGRLSGAALSKTDAVKWRARFGICLTHTVDDVADCFAVAHGSVHVFVHGSVLGDVEEVVGSALHVKEDDDEEKGGD